MQEIPRDIIIKAKEGTIEAFEEIYRIASSYVYTIALRITNRREDAEEATQDVFMSVYKNLKNFKFKSSFKTWLYRITVNAALNMVKRKEKESKKTIHYDECKNIEDAAYVNPEGIGAADNERLIKSMLTALSSEQRACIVLKEIEGLKYKEIAETLRININTVRSRLKRARQRLILLYKRGGSGDEM